jgi:CRISPR-associated protein Cas6
MIDLCFVVTAASPVPADHGYHLYAAVSRVLPAVHQANGIGIHPIRGRLIGDRQMELCDWSRLSIRIAPERIADFLPLAGKQLNLGARSIRVGVPQVYALTPATAVRSRLVTIKASSREGEEPSPPDESAFLAAARRQLDALGISAEVQISAGKRRTLRIKDKEVVGYEMLVSALAAQESVTLQDHGLGGRRHMGCGIFARFNPRAEHDDDA